VRAVFSWDVERQDPQFQQILLQVGDCFPRGTVKTLTNHTAVVEPMNARRFDEIDQKLRSVAQQYSGRLFYVFSLHSDRDPVWGVFRDAAGGGQ
jgi:hypothetical protein